MDSASAPTVTILIDTYNYARFVGRAIDSALQQEYAGPPIQILVVDDGSTDNTAEVVQRYGADIRYIAKNNGGQASALNAGLREAEGEYVCFLDGDDYFYPDKVQLVVDAFRRHPEIGLVYNEFDIVDSVGTSLEKRHPEPTWTGYHVPLSDVPSQLRSLIVLGHPWTCITSAMSVRRSTMADLTVPEDIFLHSPDLFLGLVLPFLAEVAIIESSETAYVFHGENVGLFRSSAVNRSMFERQMKCIRDFGEKRFGVHFVRYGGRGIYGSDRDQRVTTGRFSEFAHEFRHIGVADVDRAIKRHCYVKLVASLLLPNVLYVGLQELRMKHNEWQTRQLRRRIADARR